MFTALLFLALAFADPTPAEELLEQGWFRVEDADYEGARILANEALDREGTHQEEATYLLGFAWEWGGDPQQGIDVYEQILERWPKGQRAQDALFRKTESLAKLGSFAESQRQLRKEFRPYGRHSATDQIKISLLEGIWFIEREKTARGLRWITRTLQKAGPQDAPYYQAYARATTTRSLIRQAQALSLDKDLEKRLSHRALLIKGAEEQLAATIPLKQPRWTLRQLLWIGEGLEALGNALLDADAADADLKSNTEVLWVRALNYYERGLDYAAAVEWKDEPIADLQNAKASISQKIEAL